MLNKIILIAVFLVIGLMTYNYFLGTAREKEQAQEIFIKGTEAIDASARLLKAEYEKFNNGKYDDALDNMNSLLVKLKEKGEEVIGEITSWEKRKEEWDRKKNDLEELINSSSGFVNEEVRKAAEDLEKESKELRVEGKFIKEKAE